jgi:hypothetical protein
MIILDSLFMSGLRWVLNTVVTAAETEMNDDTALREQLLAAEMRREMGEISDEEFADLEADLLARIRDIKERREGGSGPIAFGKPPIETTADSQFEVEATISGDFHEPLHEPVAFEAEPVTAGDDSGTVIQGTLVDAVEAPKVRARTVRTEGTPGTTRTNRTTGTTRATRTTRTTRTARTPRTAPTSRPAPTSRMAGTSRTAKTVRSSRKIR